MKDYAALEAAAAQNPRLNDVLVQQGENYISLRSTFGLWLKKEGRQINAPTVESLQEYPPGYDMVLDFTQAVDSKVHFKQRTVPLSFVCLRPKEQWETIRSGLENALQGRWLEFYFSRTPDQRREGQFSVEFTPGDITAEVSISVVCAP